MHRFGFHIYIVYFCRRFLVVDVCRQLFLLPMLPVILRLIQLSSATKWEDSFKKGRKRKKHRKPLDRLSRRIFRIKVYAGISAAWNTMSPAGMLLRYATAAIDRPRRPFTRSTKTMAKCIKSIIVSMNGRIRDSGQTKVSDTFIYALQSLWFDDLVS